MCMHFFPAHSEKQSEPFYKVLSRPVTKQPYCTAQNHVGMGWGSKTKVSCAVSRKCFSVSRCFTQRPSKTSPPRPGHHPAQHVVAPYTIPLPDFSAALWTALCPATCAALRTRTLSNFTTALVDSTQHSTLHSTRNSTLQSTLHNTFAKLRRHVLDNTLHSTALLGQHPAQHPAKHHCRTSPPHNRSLGKGKVLSKSSPTWRTLDSFDGNFSGHCLCGPLPNDNGCFRLIQTLVSCSVGGTRH